MGRFKEPQLEEAFVEVFKEQVYENVSVKNIITERLITEPKVIDDMFNALPQSIKNAIEKRDK